MCAKYVKWGLDTSAPTTSAPTTSAPSAPFGKDTSAPRQDTSAPHEKTLRPLAKDTSAPSEKTLRPLFFQALPLRPLSKMFFKLSKLLIIRWQMIKRNLEIVKASAFVYELVIFLLMSI